MPMSIKRSVSSLASIVYCEAVLFLVSVVEVVRYLLSSTGLRSSPQKRLTRLGLTKVNGSPHAQTRESGPICLFAAYESEVSSSSIEYIRLFKDHGFRIVYINNHRTSRPWLEELSTHIWMAFDRPNQGQDTGAYKDGILWLESKGYLNSCTALAIVNDSMQFIPGKYAASMSDRISQFLASDSPALFSHVSQQVRPHYQSFFQILKPEIFLSRAYISFWKDYTPYSHRFHCIYKGEIEISKKVYNGLVGSVTLYTSESLHQKLLSFYNNAEGVAADDLIDLMPSPYRTMIEEIANPALNQLMRARDNRKTLMKSELACVSDLIENSNPTHVAAFLFPIYLECPLLKRDICFAGSFTIGQAINLYRQALEISLEESHGSDELIKDLVREFTECLYRKGVPQGYSKMRIMAIRKGLFKGFLYSPTFSL
jgi:hypothetical protein